MHQEQPSAWVSNCTVLSALPSHSPSAPLLTTKETTARGTRVSHLPWLPCVRRSPACSALSGIPSPCAVLKEIIHSYAGPWGHLWGKWRGWTALLVWTQAMDMEVLPTETLLHSPLEWYSQKSAAWGTICRNCFSWNLIPPLVAQLKSVQLALCVQRFEILGLSQLWKKSVLKMTTCMLTYADAFLVATHYLHYIRNYRQYKDDSKQLGSHAGCLQLFTILHEGIEHSKHLMFSGALESIPSG